MSVGMAENLVDVVTQYLRDHFQQKVDEFAAEFNDTLMTLPVAYYMGERTLAQGVQSYPAIYVLVPQTLVERWRPEYIDPIHDLVIGILVLQQDTEILRRQLYRYTRAIIELLVESQTSFNLGYILGAGTGWLIDYSPIFTLDEVFMADAQIQVKMKKSGMEMF